MLTGSVLCCFDVASSLVWVGWAGKYLGWVEDTATLSLTDQV